MSNNDSIIKALFGEERQTDMPADEAAYFRAERSGEDATPNTRERVWEIAADEMAARTGFETSAMRRGRRPDYDADADASELNLSKRVFGKQGLRDTSKEEAAWWAEEEAKAAQERRAVHEEEMWKKRGVRPDSDSDIQEMESILEGYRKEEQKRDTGWKPMKKLTAAEERAEEKELRKADNPQPEPSQREASVSERELERIRLDNIALEDRYARLEKNLTKAQLRLERRESSPPVPESNSTTTLERYYRQAEVEVRAVDPDYDAASKYAVEVVRRDGFAAGYTTPEDQQRYIAGALAVIVEAAEKNNLNPAFLVSQFARSRGFSNTKPLRRR